MALEILVTSDKKGSNPGGRAITSIRGQEISGYIKYCNGSRLGPNNPFQAGHQPIYEAVTLFLANLLGLRVPEYYVVQNNGVHFDYSSKDVNRLDNRRPYYLFSRLVQLPSSEDPGAVDYQLPVEKIFRDLLLITDVSGKKNNFVYFTEPQPHILYIDLGCSFVHSVDGILRLREHPRARLPSAVSKSNARLVKRYALITYDEKEIIPLSDFHSLVDRVVVPTLNPFGRVPVNRLLGSDAIDEIKRMLMENIPEVIRCYSDSPYLLRL